MASRGVPAAGGTPIPVTKLNPGEGTHRWPQVLPGSQTILFTSAAQIGTNYDDSNIEAISLQTGQRKTILQGGYAARYLADATGSNGGGHLLYLHQSILFAVPFHPGRLVLRGTPAHILEDVGRARVAGGGDMAFAPNGTLVYLPKTAEARWSISWIDSSGKTQPLHAPPGQYLAPRFSPDGKRLAFSMSNGNGSDIWVKDLERGSQSRLSFLPGANSYPVWTADGKTIVFQSQSGPPGCIRSRRTARAR